MTHIATTHTRTIQLLLSGGAGEQQGWAGVVGARAGNSTLPHDRRPDPLHGSTHYPTHTVHASRIMPEATHPRGAPLACMPPEPRHAWRCKPAQLAPCALCCLPPSHSTPSLSPNTHTCLVSPVPTAAGAADSVSASRREWLHAHERGQPPHAAPEPAGPAPSAMAQSTHQGLMQREEVQQREEVVQAADGDWLLSGE